MIDYSITCAMSNFNHKKRETDGNKTEEYSKLILKKLQSKENSLQFLLKHSLEIISNYFQN